MTDSIGMQHCNDTDGRRWLVKYLIKEAELQGLKPFKISPNVLDRSKWYWDDKEVKDMHTLVEKIKHIESVDLSKPIILDVDGSLMDGAHRICKAAWKGKDLWAVQFKETPQPSSYKKD